MPAPARHSSDRIQITKPTHDARGVGVYCVFDNAVTWVNGVEMPTAAGVAIKHIVLLRLGGLGGISHIINGTGNGVSRSGYVCSVRELNGSQRCTS